MQNEDLLFTVYSFILLPSGCGSVWVWFNVKERTYTSHAVARRERTEQMWKIVNRCVAAGCSNTATERISLFRFPRDHALPAQWEKQVQRTRAQWKATEHSYICSEHFTDDCFKVDTALASKFGISKGRRLKPGSIPTIFNRSSTLCTSAETPLSRKRAAASGTDRGTVPKRKRGAVEKRERHEVHKTIRCSSFRYGFS